MVNLEYMRQWRSKNKKKMKEYYSKYYQDNKESLDIVNKKWAKDNLKRSREIKKNWDRSNQKHRNYIEANRRAAKINATPSWTDLKEIKRFYENCPDGYHVDHITPLRGVRVCGLHVINNLQYLSAIENIKKSNKV